MSTDNTEATSSVITNENSGENYTYTDFESVVIDEPLLADLEAWEQNMQVVKILCELGSPTEFCAHDSYEFIPYKYDVKGIKVEFLPHWGFYTVGGLNLDVPKNKDQVTTDIELITELQSTVKNVSEKFSERLTGQIKVSQ